MRSCAKSVPSSTCCASSSCHGSASCKALCPSTCSASARLKSTPAMAARRASISAAGLKRASCCAINCASDCGRGSSACAPACRLPSAQASLSVSSANSGLPPLRWRSAAAMSCPTTPARCSESTSAAICATSSGCTITRVSGAAVASASSKACKGEPGSGGRKPRHQRDDAALRGAASRLCSSSTLALSAKCTSSSTRPATLARARCSSSATGSAIDVRGAPRWLWLVALCGASSSIASVGNKGARSRRSRASSASGTRSTRASKSRAKLAYGTSASPGRPAAKISALSSAASVCSRRDLPMPASPLTTTTLPARQPWRSACSSASRPMRRGGRSMATGTA